jgi:hypothetical protein
VARENNLGHVEADAELSFSHKARAKLVEIAEELRDAGAVLFAEDANASKHILNIVRLKLNDVSFYLSGLCARVIIERLVVRSTHTKHTLVGVDIIAEIDIVDFINISLIHVSLGDDRQDVLRSVDAELGKHSEELVPANVAALSDVKVLELGLQVDASVQNGLSVLLQQILHLILFLRGMVEILTSCS